MVFKYLVQQGFPKDFQDLNEDEFDEDDDPYGQDLINDNEFVARAIYNNDIGDMTDEPGNYEQGSDSDEDDDVVKTRNETDSMEAEPTITGSPHVDSLKMKDAENSEKTANDTNNGNNEQHVVIPIPIEIETTKQTASPSASVDMIIQENHHTDKLPINNTENHTPVEAATV